MARSDPMLANRPGADRGRVPPAVPGAIVALIVAGVFLHLLGPLGGLILLAYGGYTFYGGLQLYKRRQAVLHTPTTKAGAAAIGPAELRGPVRSDVTWDAPISGARCVFWQVDVWELERDSKGRVRWRHTVREERSPDVFTLEDDTGQICVLP